MAKKVKIIDPREQYRKLNKVSKTVLSIGTVVGILSAISILTISILALCGIFPMPTKTTRIYGARFHSFDGEELFYHEFKRGEKLVYEIDDSLVERPDDANGTTYTFLGWDINSDSIPDILPSKMYYSFNAYPVYFEFNPYGKKSVDEENYFPSEVILDASK